MRYRNPIGCRITLTEVTVALFELHFLCTQ